MPGLHLLHCLIYALNSRDSILDYRTLAPQGKHHQGTTPVPAASSRSGILYAEFNIMQRNKILNLFTHYRARYPEEAAVVDRISAFVEANADCFSRELAIGHITGSAWILDSTGTRALLTHHKKLDIWVQLGGHADGDPDVAQVAYREAIEESGLAGLEFVDRELFDIDIHQIPARGHEAAHYHYDCRFLFRAVDDDYTVSDESHDLLWVPLADMCSVTGEPSIMRMVAKTQILMRASSSADRSG